MPHLDEGKLQEWLDRSRSAMDDAEARQIEEHLAACEGCAARVEALRSSTDRARSILALGDIEDVAVPDFGTIRDRAGVREDSSGGGLVWGRRAWAASVVLALGVGWMGNELIRRGSGASDATSPTVVASSERGNVNDRAESASGVPPQAAAESQSQEAATDAEVAAAPVPAPGPVAGRAAQAPSTRSRQLNPGGADTVAAEFRLQESDLAPGEIIATDQGDGTQRGARGDSVRTLGFSGTVTDLDEVETRVGFTVAAIPDLEVVEVELLADVEPARVRVSQRLPNGRLLHLTQVPDPEELLAPLEGVESGEPHVWIRRDGMLLEASGRLPADSLRAVLERVR